MVFWKTKQFWGAVIGVLLLIWCFRDIRLSELRLLAQRADLIWLVPSVVASFLFIIFRALRLRLLVRSHAAISVGHVIPLAGAATCFSVGMPALTGQVGKLLLLSRHLRLKKSFIFSTMFLEVIFDAISLLALVFLTSLVFRFPDEYAPIGWVLLIGTTIGVVLLAAIMLFRRHLESLAGFLFRNRARGLYVSIRRFIRTFVRGATLLRSSQHTVGALFLSFVAWVFHLGVIYFLFLSFDVDLESPWTVSAAMMIINTVVLMIPISPGNAGVFELTVKTFLTKLTGLTGSDSILFAVTLHLLDLLPIFSLGFLFLRLTGRKHLFATPPEQPVGSPILAAGQHSSPKGKM